MAKERTGDLLKREIGMLRFSLWDNAGEHDEPILSDTHFEIVKYLEKRNPSDYHIIALDLNNQDSIRFRDGEAFISWVDNFVVPALNERPIEELRIPTDELISKADELFDDIFVEVPPEVLNLNDIDDGMPSG